MRTLISLALATGLAFVLGASQASALSSVNLVPLQLGTGGAPCTNGIEGVDCTHTVPSDIIRFAIVIDVDTAGFSAYSFDLRWDNDGEDELDLVNHRVRGYMSFTATDPGPPPSTVTIGYQPDQAGPVVESTPGNAGAIEKWIAIGKSPLPPYVASVSFRIGVVAFHVNPNVNKNPGDDIELGFFTGFAGGNTFLSAANTNVTPQFSSFAVDSVPEPGTSLLMGLGVLGLVLAGRASRKA